MAGLLACLLHDVAHPGMTNSFLISVKHAKAIRYNDLSFFSVQYWYSILQRNRRKT